MSHQLGLPRRRLLLAGLALVATACSPESPPPPTAGAAAANATPKATATIMTGRLTRAAIQALPGWGKPSATDFSPDPAALTVVRQNSTGVECLLFLGTWCPDSKREVPRFLEVMDQTGWPESGLTIYGLDRSKKDAEGLTEKWDVKYVPTFIFLKDGKELGRVIEKPQATLDGDVSRILTGQTMEARAAAGLAAEPLTLDIREVKTLLDGPSKPPIFDARPKETYDAGHVPGAISLPLADLDKRIAEVPKDQLAIFYCWGKT